MDHARENVPKWLLLDEWFFALELQKNICNFVSFNGGMFELAHSMRCVVRFWLFDNDGNSWMAKNSRPQDGAVVLQSLIEYVWWILKESTDCNSMTKFKWFATAQECTMEACKKKQKRINTTTRVRRLAKQKKRDI